MTDFVDSPIDTIPTIAIDTGGLFTPGAAYAIKLSADLVNKCFALAESKSLSFDDKMDALTNAVTGYLTAHAAADVTAGSISVTAPTEPSMTIADTSVALATGTISTQSAAIISESVTKFSSFMSTYFPDIDDTYTAAEAYLLSAITNTTSGIVPSAIKDAIVESSRDDVLAEANRATAELEAGASARRQRFPSGATNGQARRIAQEALRQIAATSRATAIKDFELSHQTALEAVRMAISSRATAINAAQQYIAGVVAQGWSSGIQGAATAHGAEVSKLQAAYQAFATRVGEAERKLKETQADKALALDAAKTNQSKDLQELDLHAKSFLADAHMTGQQMVAATNNLRSGSSATYGVNAT